MPTFSIVEALDVVEHVSLGFVTCAIGLRAVRSVFSDEKKLSIAALSQTLPERLIEQTMPLIGHQLLDTALLVYWLPRSE